MRLSIVLVATFLAPNLFATKDDLSGKSLLAKYAVVSDSVNKAIPAGSVLVTGRIAPLVHSGDGELRHDFTTALIATLDRKHTATIDINGNYKLMLTPKDTSIFFFMESLEEIVIWKYKFKSQHHVHIDFYPQNDYDNMTVDKPVIYLYNETELQVDLQFSCIGELTFTYPKYTNGWNLSVAGNTITDLSSGKMYPYLFWESTTSQLNFQSDENSLQGFVVSKDTLVSFLENSLATLGLNSTERTDFITYWAPRMIKTDYVLIQFLIDDDYDATISQLTIEPKPNAMRRVFMLYTALEVESINKEIERQELHSFSREGFTLVEWGGCELNNQFLIP